MLAAVWPVTRMVETPYASSRAGVWARSSRTRSLVAVLFCPPAGTTWTSPVSAPSSGVSCGTATTPGIFRMPSASWLTVSWGLVL